MKMKIYLRNAVADILMRLSVKIRPLPMIRSIKVEGLDADWVMTKEEFKLGGGHYFTETTPDLEVK